MNQFESYLPSILALSPLLLISVYLTISRPRIGPSAESGRFLLAGSLATASQAIHFTEELLSNFAGRFPEALGFSPMNTSVFALFNLTWIAIWGVCVWRVRAGNVFALIPLWFLGIAAILNLPAHVYLSVRSGGYFPGVITAPIVAAAGVFLIAELNRVQR